VRLADTTLAVLGLAGLALYLAFSIRRAGSVVEPPTVASSQPVSSAPGPGPGPQPAHCQVRGGLPDPRCTPGEIIPGNTADVVCNPRWSTRSIRGSGIGPAEKRALYRVYNISHPRPRDGSCEVDHLIPLELGGADSFANVWPQCYSEGATGPGAAAKDDLENALWHRVCVEHSLSLKEAQRELANDWIQAWNVAGRPQCHNRRRCGGY